jgi:hypothetical protein
LEKNNQQRSLHWASAVGTNRQHALPARPQATSIAARAPLKIRFLKEPQHESLGRLPRALPVELGHEHESERRMCAHSSSSLRFADAFPYSSFLSQLLFAEVAAGHSGRTASRRPLYLTEGDSE